MDRRSLLAGSFAALATYNFPCCRRALAGPASFGCQLTAGAASGFRRVSGSFQALKASGQALLEGPRAFNVSPELAYIDDHESPNAYAAPDGPGGTVYLGVTLVRLLPEKYVPFVLHHEFAHILQFKKGMRPGSAWQMEPHADFLAGWAYAHAYMTYFVTGELDIETGAKAMFSLGDIKFNSPQHHGEPQFRAAMVRAGYESGKLSLDEAFERGKKYAGLS
jgi:hypothetical protein